MLGTRVVTRTPFDARRAVRSGAKQRTPCLPTWAGNNLERSTTECTQVCTNRSEPHAFYFFSAVTIHDRTLADQSGLYPQTYIQTTLTCAGTGSPPKLKDDLNIQGHTLRNLLPAN
jgi:hypothetical protein